MDTSTLIKTLILALVLGAFVLSFVLFRKKRKEILLGSFSLLFVIIITEVFLRFFYPQVMEHDKMFEYDSYLGWMFIPNKRGAIVYPGEAHHFIETNSIGFRDDPIPSDRDEINRIMVLGDSFVSNISVHDGEVFTEILERRLENTSVLNFGVNGYGQVQEYLLLQKWIDKINPDLIIVVIYIRNDFTDNTGGDWYYPRPFATWDPDDQTLRIHPTPPDTHTGEVTSEPFWKFYRRSHLYLFLDRRFRVLLARYSQVDRSEPQPTQVTPPELYLCRSRPAEKTVLLGRIMEELLLRIAGVADKRGVPIVFVLAPSAVQIEDGLWSSLLAENGEKEEDFIRSLPDDQLAEFAEKNNLMMIDLLPIFRLEEKNGNTLYNRQEQHWNRYGNQVAARSIYDFLKDRSLID